MQGPWGVAGTKDCHQWHSAFLRPRETRSRARQAQCLTRLTALIPSNCFGTSFQAGQSAQAPALHSRRAVCSFHKVLPPASPRFTARAGARATLSCRDAPTAGQGQDVCSHSGDLFLLPFVLPGSEPLLLPTAEVASGSNLKRHRHKLLLGRRSALGRGEHPPHGAP